MKFEPGKKYLNSIGEIYKFIGYDGNWGVAKRPDGLYTSIGTATAWREYKEPVVHTRYVHWYRDVVTKKVETYTLTKMDINCFTNPAFKIDKITYTEE